MYWRVKSGRMTQFRFLVGKDVPYTSQDFLELSDDHVQIDQSKLNYSFDSDGDDRYISDFVLSEYRGILIAKASCFNLFEELINEIEFKVYKAECNQFDFLIFCCMTEVAGFDFDRSAFESFEDGDIFRIDKLAIRPNFSTDIDIFRLADDWAPRFELIVSSRFVEIYREHNLTGLEFISTS